MQAKDCFKINCSSIFLAPAVFHNKELAHIVGFKNSYLDDVNYEHTPHNPLFCLFKSSEFEKFDHFFRGEKENNPELVMDYDYHEGGLTMLVYSIDSKYNEDYQKFLEGKYSQLSKEFIARIPKTVKGKDKYGNNKETATFGRRIIEKDETIRQLLEEMLNVTIPKETELWTVPNTMAEVFDLEQYLKENKIE